MRVERLFNVLVLGGAALSASGCNDAVEDDAGGSGGATGASTATGATATGSTATGSGSGGGDGAGGAGATGATATGTGATGSGTTGAGGAGECTPEPDPGDACGCPCCWVADCNNDEPCCAAFCGNGNGGAGCCP